MYINRNEKFYLRKKTEGYCDEASIKAAKSAINAFFGFDDDFKKKKQEPGVWDPGQNSREGERGGGGGEGGGA